MQTSGANQKPSIVFFGSGPVAAASLKLLLESFTIETVVTKPRPPHHRGDVPVLAIANKHQLPVIEASSKKELSEKIAEHHFSSPVAILIDFGIIVTRDIIDAFPLGIVNSHFSLLPEWRGADPITFAILSGQKRTGVSLMLLVEAMDEGPIIAFGVENIDSSYTAPVLTERLIQLSYSLLCAEISRYIENPKTVAQSELPGLVTDFAYPATPSYSRKLSKQDSVLDFSKPAEMLEREIRAFVEWPKSRTVIAEVDVVITSAHAAPSQPAGAKPGDYDYAHHKKLGIVTATGTLWIERLKPAGKPEMDIAAFLAGYGNRFR